MYLSITLMVTDITQIPVQRRCASVSSSVYELEHHVVYIGHSSILLLHDQNHLLPVTSESRGLVPSGITVLDKDFPDLCRYIYGLTNLIPAAALPTINTASSFDLAVPQLGSDQDYYRRLYDYVQGNNPQAHKLAKYALAEGRFDRLLGLGEGSTPTGDDILSGMLAGAQSLSNPQEVHAIWNTIAPLLYRTTRISAHQLYYASLGQVSCSHLDLFKAILRKAGPSEISLIAADIGHTSGLDFLYGLSYQLYINQLQRSSYVI